MRARVCVCAPLSVNSVKCSSRGVLHLQYVLYKKAKEVLSKYTITLFYFPLMDSSPECNLFGDTFHTVGLLD